MASSDSVGALSSSVVHPMHPPPIAVASESVVLGTFGEEWIEYGEKIGAKALRFCEQISEEVKKMDHHLTRDLIVGGAPIQDSQARDLLTPIRANLENLTLYVKSLAWVSMYLVQPSLTASACSAAPPLLRPGITEQIRSQLSALAPHRLPPDYSWAREESVVRYREAVQRMTDLMAKIPPFAWDGAVMEAGPGASATPMTDEGAAGSGSSTTLPPPSPPAAASSCLTRNSIAACAAATLPATAPASASIPSTLAPAPAPAAGPRTAVSPVSAAAVPRRAEELLDDASREMVVLNALLDHVGQKLNQLSEANGSIRMYDLEYELAVLAGDIHQTRTRIKTLAAATSLPRPASSL